MDENKNINELVAEIDELKKIVMILNDHIISFKEARKVYFTVNLRNGSSII